MSIRKVDRDRLNQANRKHTATTTMALLDRIQDEPVEIQLAASAALFLNLSNYLGVAPSEVLGVAARLQEDAAGSRPEFKAVRAYMENELK